MENQIATIEHGGQLVGIENPDGVMDIAIRAAKTLAGVVSQKKKPVIMNGEQYLEYEDWQTLGQFYGVTAITGDAVLVEIDGVKGAKASAKLINFRTGEIIGGAEAYCMRDEERWSTRPKYEYQNDQRVKVGDEPVPWFQLASMAQTRAGAKALRNRLAWVAVLAGYKPTPAEEMIGTEVQHDEAGHWCKKHNTAFFKRGKMKAFAHPVAGSEGEWCSESIKTEAEPTMVPGSDTWILDKVKALQIDEVSFLAYVNETLHIPVDLTLTGTLLMINDKQRAEIAKAINAKEKKETK